MVAGVSSAWRQEPEEAMRNKRETLSRKGKVFLDRWGFETRFGGVYLHHLVAPDPGRDPHDHPWWFMSIVLNGGYVEQVTSPRSRMLIHPTRKWRQWSAHFFGKEYAHRIIRVMPDTWTLVIRGPRTRTWGFYTPEFVPYWEYDVSTPFDVPMLNTETRA